MASHACLSRLARKTADAQTSHPHRTVFRLRADVLALFLSSTLCALTATSLMASSPALAADVMDTSAKRTYALPAGKLSDALAEFAALSGVQLVFEPQQLAGLQSRPLQGQYSVQDGFARLLADTTYEAVATSGGRYVLRPLPETTMSSSVDIQASGVTQLSPVIVTGLYRGDLTPVYAGGKVATGSRVGLLGYKDFMETPFSTISYTEEAVRQAQDLARVIGSTDAAVYDLGMRGTVREAFVIRGFDVGSGDIAFGGLYGLLPYNRVPLELVERVEVLKGPSAMLNGMPPGGSVGGSVNLVPKRATETPLARLTGMFVSDGQFGSHVDVGRRFGDKQQFGIRFNGLYQDGSTATDKQSKRATLAALGLDWRTDTVRLAADFYVSKDNVKGVTRGITVGRGLDTPDVPKPGQALAPDWTYSRAEDTAFVLRGEADLSKDVTVYGNYGQGSTDYDGLLGVVFAVTDPQGRYRNNFGQQRQVLDRKAGDVGIMARLSTGSVRHELALSASYYEQEVRSKTVVGLLPTDWYTNIYAPTWGPAPATVIGKSDVPKTALSRLSSVGIADTLSLADDSIMLTLGIRHQNVLSESFHPVSGVSTARYKESATSPSAALLVKLSDEVSVYGNYIEGLREGAIAPVGTNNAGEIFAPHKTRQHEVGVKLDLGDFAATLSAYQIRLPNSYIDPTSNIFSFDGEQRNRGLELNFFGEPVEGLRLMGGIAYLDAELSKTAGGVNQGRFVMARPKWQGKLGVEWDVPGVTGLTATGNMQAIQGQYYSSDNSMRAAGRTIFDAGLRYQTSISGHALTLRADVLNIANKAYWSAGGSGKLWQGAPRTFMLSASMDF
ncbi:TonB-dependent siderophore receptor [Alcaligenes phenolicus]|uniref:TonB-dependent siderophore receptor n=1 Tax=Alcaligenes phenolicus TaxID=232846 RepID=UPI00352C3F65